MNFVYSTLFYLTCVLAFLSTGSTVYGLFQNNFAPVKEKILYIVLSLVLIAVAWFAYQFKQQEKPGSAVVLLSVFWGIVLVITIWAVMNARWN